MTVLAVIDQPDYVAMVVDSIVIKSEVDGVHAVQDKICAIREDAFTSLVGDELVELALSVLVRWASYKGRKLDLLSEQDAQYWCEASNFVRPACELLHSELPAIQGATVYAIERSGWQAWCFDPGPDNVYFFSGKPRKSMKLSNFLHINYGGKIIEVPFGEATESGLKPWPEDRVIAEIIACIHRIHEAHKVGKMEGGPLNYDFEGRFSGVLLPKDPNKKPRSYSPFGSLSEIFAGMAANKDGGALLRKFEWHWSPF